MTDQKRNENTTTPNSNILGSSEQDFSGLNNLKLNDLEATTPAESLISQANAEEEIKPPKEEVKFENLGMRIQPTEDTLNKVELGESGVIGAHKSKYHNQYWRLFLLSFFIILVTGIASIILRLYSRYIYFASQALPDTTYQTYIDTYKQGQTFIDKLLKLSNYQQYSSLSIVGSGEESNVDKVIQDKSLSYIQKKDVLQQALNSFSTILIANSQKLTTLKEDISKYGFFSQELYDLLENQSYSTSIKKYLLSLEIIKFSSAIKVFSYLDTFISSLANALKLPATQVQTEMNTFADRGEKDILVYLNNCYLNPYEIDYDCNMVGDFDRYYALIDKEKTPPDTNFFKKMMYYVDTKLEQTDLPSFSITFKKYDPTQKQISFTVEVNTFKQDEVALIKKGIINPHIFILSNLLNLIKQSVFVVSENIDAKSIKITPKIIKIGSSVFNVNNSTMNFVLPIQKGSEREISDYVDPIFTSSP
ncbi:MAG: hypothetical protein WC606_04600 [Candidatus Absconditabacterales bacterium]